MCNKNTSHVNKENSFFLLFEILYILGHNKITISVCSIRNYLISFWREFKYKLMVLRTLDCFEVIIVWSFLNGLFELVRRYM